MAWLWPLCFTASQPALKPLILLFLSTVYMPSLLTFLKSWRKEFPNTRPFPKLFFSFQICSSFPTACQKSHTPYGPRLHLKPLLLFNVPFAPVKLHHSIFSWWYLLVFYLLWSYDFDFLGYLLLPAVSDFPCWWSFPSPPALNPCWSSVPLRYYTPCVDSGSSRAGPAKPVTAPKYAPWTPAWGPCRSLTSFSFFIPPDNFSFLTSFGFCFSTSFPSSFHL